MQPRTLAWTAALLAAGLLPAQSLKVYSEFRRIDPFGEIVAADRGGKPREILSPAAARNAHVSYHLVVTPPPGAYFHLHVGQNPEDSFRVTLYRELYTRQGQEWIPDRLVRVPLPYTGRVPDPEQDIAGQTAAAFWLDVLVPVDTRTGRIKLEPQLNIGQDWIVYPMEVRVFAATVPAFVPVYESPPPLAAPSAAASLEPLVSFVCGAAGSRGSRDLTVRRLIQRNAWEDMTLARSLAAVQGKDRIALALLKPLGVSDPATWCATPRVDGPLGPEWYLRARDFLYQGALH